MGSLKHTMKRNFKAQYEALISEIIAETLTLLKGAELSEITLFEGHPFDKENSNTIKPLYETFWVCDEQERRFVKKVIKCDDKWGIVLYNTEDMGTEFPIEISKYSLSFECAESMYRAVYYLLEKNKMIPFTDPSDVNALEVLKRKLAFQ